MTATDTNTVTYAEWHREQGCNGKRAWRTQMLAMHAAVRAAYAVGDPITAWDYYPCPGRQHWHITSNRAGGGSGG